MIASGLAPRALLRAWERGDGEPSASTRALILLEAASANSDPLSLVRLSVGERDRRLLGVRQGPQDLSLCGVCPSCEEEVELTLPERDLRRTSSGSDREGIEQRFRFEIEGMCVEFRLPNSADLEVAGMCPDLESAREALLDRCVSARSAEDGQPVSGNELSPQLQAEVERAMEALDPLAAVSVRLKCPACSLEWDARLDLSEVVWAETAARVQRLVEEVALLARAYHWSERSILAMSARRRRLYLELAAS